MILSSYILKRFVPWSQTDSDQCFSVTTEIEFPAGSYMSRDASASKCPKEEGNRLEAYERSINANSRKVYAPGCSF